VVATARTIKFSARLLDLSPQTLAKGIRAGVIPEITAGNLSALAAIPVLTRARTDDGFDIPVLRVGVQAPSPWDAYTPARPYTGYGALAAPGIITALGGWTVVLLAGRRHRQGAAWGGNCLHYNARQVARCDSLIDQADPGHRPTHPFTAHAHELLGKRVLGGGGGTITRLATGDAA
jgi:hypothetical protein